MNGTLFGLRKCESGRWVKICLPGDSLITLSKLAINLQWCVTFIFIFAKQNICCLIILCIQNLCSQKNNKSKYILQLIFITLFNTYSFCLVDKCVIFYVSKFRQTLLYNLYTVLDFDLIYKCLQQIIKTIFLLLYFFI